MRFKDYRVQQKTQSLGIVSKVTSFGKLMRFLSLAGALHRSSVLLGVSQGKSETFQSSVKKAKSKAKVNAIGRGFNSSRTSAMIRSGGSILRSQTLSSQVQRSTLVLRSSYSGLKTLLTLSRKGIGVISGKGVTSAIVLGITRSYGKGISVKQIGSGSSSSSLIFNSLIAAVG